MPNQPAGNVAAEGNGSQLPTLRHSGTRAASPLAGILHAAWQLPLVLNRADPEQRSEFFADWREASEKGRERFELYLREKNQNQHYAEKLIDEDDVRGFAESRDLAKNPLSLDVNGVDSEDSSRNASDPLRPFLGSSTKDKGRRGSMRVISTPDSVSTRSFSVAHVNSKYFMGRSSSPMSKHSSQVWKSEICSADPITGDVTVDVDGNTFCKSDFVDGDRLTNLFYLICTFRNVTQLNITQFRIGTSGADILASGFHKFFNLRALLLNNTVLNSPGATAIARGLIYTTALTNLNLEENNMGAKGVKAVAESLCHCSMLRHINLAKNNIICEGAASFAKALSSDFESRNGAILLSLNLKKNMIGPTGCVALSEMFAKFGSGLQFWDMSENPLTSCGNDFSAIYSLFDAIKVMTSLCSLNLAETELHSEGGRIVVEGLTFREKELKSQIWAVVRKAGEEKKSQEMELIRLESDLKIYQSQRALAILNLDRNMMSVDSFNILGEYKGIFKKLKTLSLASNDLTGNMYNPTFDGISAFATGLKSARNLEELVLSDNRMSSEDGQQSCFAVICESMSQLPNLKHLDLSRNNLGVKDIQRLASVLGRLAKLVRLNLSSNRLGSDGLKSLAPALKGTLTEINLANNNVGPDGITALAMRVSEITNVVTLNLAYNHFSVVLGDEMEGLRRSAEASSQAADASKTGKSSIVPKSKKIQYSTVFRSVASKMSEPGSEVRKAALFGNSVMMSDAIQRGFPLFARRCAEHLSQIQVIYLGKEVKLEAGRVRGSGPSREKTLNFSHRNFGKENIILFFELLKLNTSVTALSFAANELMDQDVTDTIRADCLSDWLSQASQLTQLDLSNTSLRSSGVKRIAVGLEGATNLRDLRLPGNFISRKGFSALSRSLYCLSSLTYLNLSDNMLMSDGVSNLSKSHKLHEEEEEDVESSSFMDALKNCVALEVLDLRRCSLKNEGAIAFSSVLRYLTSLLQLYVAENDIGIEGQEELATALHTCAKMHSTDGIEAPLSSQTTWLLKNRIEFAYQVSFVGSCIKRHQLISLDLSGNRLGRFPESFLALASSFAASTSITELDLSHNSPFNERLCHTLATSLRSMSHLKTLKLADNSIGGEGASAVMCAIITLRELRVLDVQLNSFQYAPCALPECCPNLARLDVMQNPWLAPPVHIMEKKTYREIRDGILGLYGDGVLNKELVLAVVGEEDTGKTSLIQSLISTANKFPVLEDRPIISAGINFYQWKPQGDEGPQFTVYDYSGLHVYRNMQEQFFLTRRCLYCLVWRPFSDSKASEDQTDGLQNLLRNPPSAYKVRGRGQCVQAEIGSFLSSQITPWLNALYPRVPGCHILLVATHSDEVTDESLNWQCSIIKQETMRLLGQLRNTYKELKVPEILNQGDSICVSNLNGTAITNLRDILVDSTKALPFYGELLPKAWIRALQSLRSEASKGGVATIASKTTKIGEQKTKEGRRRAPRIASVGASSASVYGSMGSNKQNLPDKGYMRMVYFKKLLKECSVEDCHMMSMLRYFHDSGWVRFFGFDETLNRGMAALQAFGGFEYLDAYRSTSTKIATTSNVGFLSKTPPPNVRDKDWANLFDTIVIDMEWLSKLVSTFLCHDARRLLNTWDSMSASVQQEALHYVETSTFTWKRGSPGLLSHFWGYFMPESDFRIMRNILVAKKIFKYLDKNLLLVSCMYREKKAGDKAFYISYDFESKGQKREGDIRPHIRILNILTDRIQADTTLATNPEASDQETRKSISECKIFMIVLTDSYFDSQLCRAEFEIAVELGLEFVAIITSECCAWPPNSDGVWISSRHLSFWPALSTAYIVDLSRHEYLDILDYFRDDDASFSSHFEDPSSDPLCRYLLSLASRERESLRNAQQEYFLQAYHRFQAHTKHLFLQLAGLMYKRSLFVSSRSPQAVEDSLHRTVTAWQESKDRAGRLQIMVEELQNNTDSSGVAGDVADESSDDKCIQKIKAEIVHQDPLHAKITALRGMANIHRGLGTNPLWHRKDEVLSILAKGAEEKM